MLVDNSQKTWEQYAFELRDTSSNQKENPEYEFTKNGIKLCKTDLTSSKKTGK